MIGRSGSSLLLVGLLGMVGAALYGRTVTFDFVRADDTSLIAENQEVLGDLRQAPRLFRQSYFDVQGEEGGRKTYYRPLVVLSYMLDAQVAGAAPWAYHLTNVTLHVVATWLFFALLRALGVPPLPAFWAALVFIVHPVNVQAVAWVPGRNDLLLAIFLLLSLLAFVRYGEDGRVAALLWHSVGFGLALFTKEPAVLIPLLAWLYAWLWRGRPAIGRKWGLVLLDSAWLVLWLTCRAGALRDAGPGSGFPMADWATVVGANLPDLLLYVGKTLLPFNLNTAPGLDPAGFAWGVLALVAWVLLLAPLPPRRRLFVAAWFVLLLAPGLFVVALPAYEHRAYGPLMGLLAGLAAAGWFPDGRTGQRGRWGLALALVGIFTAITATRLGVFQNPVAFWTDAAASSRHAPLAHVNLGHLFEERGDFAEAARHYREALALDETTPMANNNLGVLLMKEGRAAEAEALFLRELAFNPANVHAQYNLGLYYDRAGRPEEAVAAWERAVALDPGFLPAYERLAAAYSQRGRTEEAARYRAKARALAAGRRE